MVITQTPSSRQIAKPVPVLRWKLSAGGITVGMFRFPDLLSLQKCTMRNIVQLRAGRGIAGSVSTIAVAFAGYTLKRYVWVSKAVVLLYGAGEKAAVTGKPLSAKQNPLRVGFPLAFTKCWRR